MRPGERTLTATQVASLAAMVRERLANIGDPAIRAPSPSEYRAERHWMPRNYYDFSVEIDIGTTVLTLRSESPWRGMLDLGPHLDALSDAIGRHVILARNDHAGLSRLAAAEISFRAKVRRDRLPLELLSVRFAPAETDRPASTLNRGFWVRLGLLDDMLLPYTDIVIGRTVREICRKLRQLGDDQIRRLAASGRLTQSQAALEVEAAAEHAIGVAGRDLSEVVQTMFDRRKPDIGSGQPVVLDGDPHHGDYVSVVALDGCIRLEASFPDIWWTLDRGLIIRSIFPDDVAAEMVGTPLRTLVDHPLLHGDAVIAEAIPWGPYQTRIQLEPATRPIGRTELGWGAC